ncbi:hypothetical protein SERLA73DRAFT_176294 [Serpula lacrymans var. lacrymans S7.3]|uniref:Sugar phosphate phosphatase n=1 Tax=Serpula lacrymans var. lacrymans (strain S7.3) TaxID=936435 RepID=F8PMN2_SERL3|nr:hypothetical protein SERLA73DRAFT_176294 [Serpula lacrymans var. lacrymans S7.3]
MFEAPFPPYDPIDKAGFSYDTVVKRWPIILTGIIDHLHGLNHRLTMESQRLGSEVPASAEKITLDEKVSEGKGIIEKISRLKYRMARDHELEPIPQDGDSYVEEYNADLAKLAQNGQNTWFTAPWLYAECYLYRLFRAYFNETKHWRGFDPFFAQKQDMFKNSGAAIYKIATSMYELESERDKLKSDPSKLGILFKEMIQMCLWDLSLLTHLSPSDIEHLQTVGKDAQEARKEFILRDDQNAVWEHIKSLEGQEKRVDFILDNAGFELFTDFVFADFLVTYTPYASKAVFHPKLMPWFVSDVTPVDFSTTITSLLSTSFFTTLPSAPSPTCLSHLERMVTRWKTYLNDGTFTLSTDLKETNPKAIAEFWTGPWPYWNMRERAGTIYDWLSDSGLVIFKVWPLAGSFPLLSLRTNKADVAVGIPQEVADELDAKGEKWRVSGRYALVSFSPKC